MVLSIWLDALAVICSVRVIKCLLRWVYVLVCVLKIVSFALTGLTSAQMYLVRVIMLRIICNLKCFVRMVTLLVKFYHVGAAT